MSKLWKGLEQAGADSAPCYNWKQWLGDALEIFIDSGYLCHTSSKVESFTLNDRFGCPICYRVIEHSPQDIVAVSDDGDRLKIDPGDRMVITVNCYKLAESLSTACGFNGLWL